jgi:hypothetical protein
MAAHVGLKRGMANVETDLGKNMNNFHSSGRISCPLLGKKWLPLFGGGTRAPLV